ncbi:hypothetical protein RDI58_007239 [Solanum bulbocastanum]|uniref:Uncharacterized protein n=1 Tax=Solanum bulbocastanum TaxID=147425 RepID=A0AAN8TYD9_SOLBU
MENLPESPFSEPTLISSLSSPSLCNISSSLSFHLGTQQNFVDLDGLTPNQLVLLLHDDNLRGEVTYQLIKGKMSQADKDESATNFANKFAADEWPMDLGIAGETRLPPEVGIVVFQITSLMLHLLDMKALFEGKTVEDANRHLKILFMFASLSRCGILAKSLFC